MVAGSEGAQLRDTTLVGTDGHLERQGVERGRTLVQSAWSMRPYSSQCSLSSAKL